MATTRKTTNKTRNQIYNYPVYKDGEYKIIKKIPTKYIDSNNKPVSLTVILYKNKAIAAIYGEGKLAILKYDDDKSTYSVDITGKYGLNTILPILNNPELLPRISLDIYNPKLVNLLPNSVLKYLGISRESIKNRVDKRQKELQKYRIENNLL